MSFTPYKQADLPYDFAALEPVISAKIMDLHYNKHHKAYVNNFNVAQEKYFAAHAKGDLEAMAALLSAINFNQGGHINHTLFWGNLAPEGKGGKPEGALAAALDKDFGCRETFIEQFNKKTVAIQGSGWGWLGYSKENHSLEIATCQNQDALSTKGLIPLLGVDVWEHAYYLQYENLRQKYVEEIWRIINWHEVSKRFQEILENK